jgi:hypothetical protein
MISLRAPGVIRLRATISDEDQEEAFHWSVYIADKAKRNDDVPVRFAVATLRAEGDGAWADIDVGCFLIGDVELENDRFLAAVQESDAPETLFDIARLHLQSQLALVGSGVQIPFSSPEGEINLYSVDGATPDAKDA